MATERKEQFRDRLKEFVVKKTGGPLDRLNDFQKSQWMTRFYVEAVLRLLNPALIPDDDVDLDACFADGPSDAAVDVLIRSEGVTLIIQAKYHAAGKVEGDAKFAHFAEVLTRLHPRSGRGYKVSSRVRELAADIDWENDRFELQFITLGKVSQNMRARERGGVSLPDVAGVNDRSELTLLDETQLNETYRDAISAGAMLSHPIELKFRRANDGTAWLRYENDDGRCSYIGYIGAGQLGELYRHKGNRHKLFALNIRNYVGSSVTNKGIIRTAAEKPKDFFFFNNGISAVRVRGAHLRTSRATA